MILSIGKKDFNRQFFNLMRREFDVTQAIVFRKTASVAAVETVLAENDACTSTCSDLALRYINRYWRRDPNAELLCASTERTLQLKVLDHAALHGTEYWYNLFERPSLVDKMSIISCLKDYSIYVNLYRSCSRGPFDSSDRERLVWAQATIATAVERHFSLFEQTADCSEEMLTKAFLSSSLVKGARLSLREAQVCARIVLGASAEDIAEEFKLSFHSVATYRKRAFAKLEITTHKQLFAHVLANRHSLNG
jgi:DNA-binding CsgD family transcriptional regulator